MMNLTELYNMAVDEVNKMQANDHDKAEAKGVIAGMYKLYRKIFLREEKFDEFFDDFLELLAYIDLVYAGGIKLTK